MRSRGSLAQEHAGIDHVIFLLRKLRLDWLQRHFPPRLVRSMYVFVNGFITIGVLALLALVSRNPFVFPSLGPTAYLLFFSPLTKASSPRNTIFGHAIGLLCGYGAFVVTGAGTVPFGVHPGIFSGPESWRPRFALGDRRIHGSFGRQPSTCWGHDANRFSRDHLETA